VHYLRLIADAQLDAAEACRAYHAELRRLRIRPIRPLEQDLQVTQASDAQRTR